jgi:group I intron endonuclease
MLIYLVTNKLNGKIYVGKTARATADQRWKWHIASARSQKRNYRLANAIRKHGADAFEVRDIVRATSVSELNALEIRHIADMNACDPEVGYNMTTGGEGGRPTDEARAKITAALTGRTPSLETRRRQSAAHIGKTLPQEQREKIGANNSRYWLGKKRSSDTLRKISEKKKGVPLPAGTGAKIAAALLGHKRTAAEVEKISARMKQIGWPAIKTAESESTRLAAVRKANQFNPSNIHELYQRHVVGEAVSAIARAIGVKHSTLKSAFDRRELRTRTHAESQQTRRAKEAA